MRQAVLSLFLLAQLLVNGLGGGLAGAHSQNDGSSAGDGIAAGVNVLTGGQAILVDHDAALLVDLQALGGGLDQGRKLAKQDCLL